MNLPVLRKLHTISGVLLILFIAVQAVTGLVLSFGIITLRYQVAVVHHGGGTAGSIYRVLLAAGLLFLVVTGGILYFQTKKLMKKA